MSSVGTGPGQEPGSFLCSKRSGPFLSCCWAAAKPSGRSRPVGKHNFHCFSGSLWPFELSKACLRPGSVASCARTLPTFRGGPEDVRLPVSCFLTAHGSGCPHRPSISADLIKLLHTVQGPGPLPLGRGLQWPWAGSEFKHVATCPCCVLSSALPPCISPLERKVLPPAGRTVKDDLEIT